MLESPMTIFSILLAIEAVRLGSTLWNPKTMSSSPTKEEKAEVKKVIFDAIEKEFLQLIQAADIFPKGAEEPIEKLADVLIEHAIDAYWDKDKTINLSDVPALTIKISHK